MLVEVLKGISDKRAQRLDQCPPLSKAQPGVHYYSAVTQRRLARPTGPAEAAYVITDRVKSSAVIASHANEMATKGGKVLPGTRTDTFIKTVKVPAYAPLSGKTMEFDGSGKCVTGC